MTLIYFVTRLEGIECRACSSPRCYQKYY